MNSAFCVVMLLLNIFCAFLSIKCGTFLLQFCGFGGAAAARRKNERERERISGFKDWNDWTEMKCLRTIEYNEYT